MRETPSISARNIIQVFQNTQHRRQHLETPQSQLKTSLKLSKTFKIFDSILKHRIEQCKDLVRKTSI